MHSNRTFDNDIDLYHAVSAAICGASVDLRAARVSFRGGGTVAVTLRAERSALADRLRRRLEARGLPCTSQTRGYLTELLVRCPGDAP